MNLPLFNGLEKSARPGPLQKLMVKFEVTGDEWLTTTFLEGLTEVEPTRILNDSSKGSHASELLSQDSVVQPSKETRERVRVTLQLVVNTGNIQIMTVASLEDRVLRMVVGLERDFLKWMRGELHIDMRTPYSPAIRHFRGHLTTCQNEAIAAVAECATKMLEDFPRERGRLLSVLSREFDWRTWSNDDEGWTRSAT